MRIQLSDHFTYKKLLKFSVSTVLMLICTSLYSIVDGFFVSNFVGKQPFAALNLIFPVIMAVGTVGFMIGSGGSAVVSIALGEKKTEQANEYFSMMVGATAVVGTIISVIGFIFAPKISMALGATGEMLESCVLYGRILFASNPFFMLQLVFQSFFIVAEKPVLSLKINIISGVANVILDFLFIVVFRWGLAGAASATAIGQVLGAVIPIFYFVRENDSLLRLKFARFHGKILLKACTNGSSEMVSNLSSSLVNILYNFQLMRLAGEDGVAAYGIIMYVNFVFTAVYIGYSVGTAPVISYHYGAGNHDELKNLFRKSLILMVSCGILLTLAAELLSVPLVGIFASYDKKLFALTCRGFRIYSLSFLLMGVNIWASSFFTALNNGGISALISFLRTLIFQIAAIVILPVLWDVNGIWMAIVAAEIFALVLSVICFIARKDKYHYM